MYYLDPDKIYRRRLSNQNNVMISKIHQEEIKEALREIREIIDYRKHINKNQTKGAIHKIAPFVWLEKL